MLVYTIALTKQSISLQKKVYKSLEDAVLAVRALLAGIAAAQVTEPVLDEQWHSKRWTVGWLNGGDIPNVGLISIFEHELEL